MILDEKKGNIKLLLWKDIIIKIILKRFSSKVKSKKDKDT